MTLDERLNQIIPKIVSDDFLCGRGLGNELAFYLFDYPPEEELKVRDFLKTMLEHLPKKRSGMKVAHINLFDFVVKYLQSRGLLEKSIDMQRTKGDEALSKALMAVLHESKLGPLFVEAAQPEAHDMVIISGVGTVWPMLRSHGLLNNLQALMGHKPLLMFFPGKYDGTSLRLFGKVKSANYYRAFRLIP